jgi:hypothetical protein
MAEPRQYTAVEAARLAGLVARAAVVVQRGRSTAPVDAAIAKLQEQACQREAAEDAARAAASKAKTEAKAARRAARRFW